MASRKTNNITSKEDPRLFRIRENQRRSRARKREYLEDLESRWKKCQELGVQANVDLQKAAQKVIDENTLLRKILSELGWGTAQVDKRLHELKDTLITGHSDLSFDIRDNGCGSNPQKNSDDVIDQNITALLETSQLSPSPYQRSGVRSERNLFEEGNKLDDVDLPSASVNILQVNVNDCLSTPTLYSPTFDTSLSETVPDYENEFDITQFLEPFDLSLTLERNSFDSIEQSESLSLIKNSGPSTPSTTIPPQQLHTSTATTKSTIPCTEAYALLKALNAQRQEHRDMLQIVLELWNGFCRPETGDDKGKSCRVDNDILQKVIDGLK